MDFAIVNVALPSIQRSLSFSDADLAWVTSGYALTFGGFLLLAGRVGDVAGRRRTFLAGIVVFTVASAVCGLAVDPAMLLAGRGLQGAGAAFTAASTLALIATAFAPGRERSRALALWGAMGGLGAGCGVVVGGALTELAGWQSIFLLNIPVGIAIAVGAVLCLPADRPEGAGRLAVVQAIAVTGGVGVLMLALSEAESDPAAPATIGRFALAAVLLGTFAVAERRSPTRLLPLGVIRRCAPVNAVALGVGTLTAAFFFLSPYLQQGLGLSPLTAGLAYVVVPAGMVAGSTVAGRLSGRMQPHIAVAIGCLLMAIGLVLLSRAPIPGTYVVDVMPGLMLLGLGRGLSAPAHVAIALEGVAERDAGAASGLLNTSIQLGAALGLTAVATLAAQASGAAIDDGATAASAMLTGTRAALAVLAVAAAASGIAAATAMRPSRLRDRVRPGGLALG